MEIVSLLSVLFPLVFSVLFLFYFSFWRDTKNTGANSVSPPPGSGGFLLVGEMVDYYRKNKEGAPERFILNRIKKYSSKVFKTSLIGKQVVFFCGAEANKFLFSNEGKCVRHWWPASTGPIFALPASKVNVSSFLLRKCAAPYFKPGTLQTFVPIMDSATKQFLKKHWDGKDVVTAYPVNRYYTFTVACRLLLGIEDEETVARLAKPFNDISCAIFSVHWNIPGTNYYRAVKSSATLKKEMEEMVKKWKEDLSDGRIKSNQLTAVFNEAFNDEEFPCAIIGLIVASYDTTSSALSSIMFYLEKFPDVYDKVLAEQRKIANSKQPGELLDWGDIQRMKYSWNVACEVMRIHPPSLGSFREATSDFSFGGYRIEKGSKIHWNPYSTQKNPEYFKDPEKFDPSRFEHNEEMPYTYVPFGGGPRMCVGMDYAKLKMLVFMHNLVTKFKWKKVNVDDKLIAGAIWKPSNGLPVRIYSHKL